MCFLPQLLFNDSWPKTNVTCTNQELCNYFCGLGHAGLLTQLSIESLKAPQTHDFLNDDNVGKFNLKVSYNRPHFVIATLSFILLLKIKL
jgi:hypothetical protein